jgi:hypothetical protein
MSERGRITDERNVLSLLKKLSRMMSERGRISSERNVLSALQTMEAVEETHKEVRNTQGSSNIGLKMKPRYQDLILKVSSRIPTFSETRIKQQDWRNTPMTKSYHPELDATPLLEDEEDSNWSITLSH